MLDSIPAYHARYGSMYLQIEWVFTALFTIEYLVRLWCSPNRREYAFGFYGVVDLLALLPTYLSLLLPQTAPLLIIRILRILRIFRVLRLLSLLNEANEIAGALRRSTRRIFVFFSLMIMLATVFGSLIYVIEGPERGFENIPQSVYWAIVTITTVGYGDIVPATPLGKALSAMGMLIGYAVIAVPTGIVVRELTRTEQSEIYHSRNCSNCATVERDRSAHYCRHCGAELPKPGHRPEQD
jgi:voltage-gated potassium channel